MTRRPKPDAEDKTMTVSEAEPTPQTIPKQPANKAGVQAKEQAESRGWPQPRTRQKPKPAPNRTRGETRSDAEADAVARARERRANNNGYEEGAADKSAGSGGGA